MGSVHHQQDASAVGGDVWTAPVNKRVFQTNSTIILVGCYGAGKRTLGFIGATYLRRRLVTEEHSFEQSTGLSRSKFIQQHGQDAFNRQMAVVLAEVLRANRFNCIIELGMGILTRETQMILRSYMETNPIIYVHRDKADIERLLNAPAGSLDKDVLADKQHREISNLEFYNLLDISGEDERASSFQAFPRPTRAKLSQIKEDFTNFLDFVVGRGLTRSLRDNPFSLKSIPPEYREYSFLMRLRLSTLLGHKFDFTEIEAGADAIEFIVDIWPDNLLDIISAHIANIRRRLDMPIFYNVEENPRDEPRRPEADRDRIDLQLLLHGLRLGVEYLIIDLDRKPDFINEALSKRGKSKILGEYSIKGFGAPQWTDDFYLDRYRKAQYLGCSVVRFARFCVQDRSDEKRQMLVDRIKHCPEPKPVLIAFDYSVLGVVTPMQGNILSPVSHASLGKLEREPYTAVATARGSLRICVHQGELQSLKFYTLGSNVYYSASPAMHRAAYDEVMLPHTFEARQCSDIEEVDRIRNDAHFGGACIAPPFKVVIMPRIDHLSSHATAIGAVNTLLPLRSNTSSILDHANARNKAGVPQSFYGDNTDWSAIMTCLRRAISPRNTVQPSRTTSLVIGAGGMARAAIYALIKLGCRKIFIHNRTVANAERVAKHFNEWARNQLDAGSQNSWTPICHVLTLATQSWPEGHLQPSMVISCIPATSHESGINVEFRMPHQWLRSPTGGVVIELAYDPRVTSLIKQMRQIREETKQAWVVVDGLEVVSEMAMDAYELMTGHKAPRTLMRKTCHHSWESQVQPFQPH